MKFNHRFNKMNNHSHFIFKQELPFNGFIPRDRNGDRVYFHLNNQIYIQKGMSFYTTEYSMSLTRFLKF